MHPFKLIKQGQHFISLESIFCLSFSQTLFIAKVRLKKTPTSQKSVLQKSLDAVHL